MSDKKNLLPPGWDCKYDENSGKCYYVNYLTRAMQLQDPRIGYSQLQNDSVESIPLQPLHGSPYHVYPANNFTAIRAFQGPNSSAQSMSGSPLLSTLSQMTMETPLLKATDSPHVSRLDSLAVNRRRSVPMQETSFTNQIDTNAVVSKIQTMFPTAGENHIRLLLKKYMKNIFPKADETLLLDVLANADNNVQKASEKLTAMGYTKRDVQVIHQHIPPKLNEENNFKNDPPLAPGEKIIPLHPKELSDAEKQNIKIQLQAKYPNITERIVSMALESVGYSEDRALQILQIVQQEDDDRAKKEANAKEINTIENMLPDGTNLIKESSNERIHGNEVPVNIESYEECPNLSSKSPYHEINSADNIKTDKAINDNTLHITKSQTDIHITYEEQSEYDNKAGNDMKCVPEKLNSDYEQKYQQMSTSTSASSSSSSSSSFLSSLNAKKGAKYIIKYRTRDKSGSLKYGHFVLETFFLSIYYA